MGLEIVLMESIATVLFLGAFMIFLNLFTLEKDIDKVIFFIMGIAMLAGTLISIFDVLEWSNITPHTSEVLEEMFTLIYGSLWVVIAFTIYSSSKGIKKIKGKKK